MNGKAGFCFFLSVNLIMSTFQSVLLVFISERPVFLREYANKTYAIWSYFLSKSLIEIPFEVIFPTILSVLIYFSVGMTADLGRFLVFTLIMVLDVLVATSIGFFLGCIFSDPSVATDASMLFMLPFIVFGGFIVNLNDAGGYISWVQYFSPIRYSTEALLRNEFEDNGDYTGGEALFDRYGYDIGLWE
mmetsp:Transcript_23349/g.20737  ORF Transcript_23349/g.20737 Transcript_23349/m.20737 type:complete len:189 (-) Transcript_23349:122-688(-)